MSEKSHSAGAPDFLNDEYSALVALYTHTENTLYNTFNYYLTLLSAITGAIIILVQLNSADLSLGLPALSLLLGLVILMGIITQDAVVNKNVDLSYYALGLNLLKHRVLRQWPHERANFIYLRNFWAPVSPPQRIVKDPLGRVHERLWWLFPLGTHQLFISLINSLALGALLLLMVRLLGAAETSPIRLIAGGVSVVFVSLIIQNTYARAKHRRAMSALTTVAGRPVEW